MASAQLDEARKAAMQKAKDEAPPEPRLPEDLDAVDALVQLLVQSYALGFTYGLGAMADGSALWLRIRVPKSSVHPCAAMVAFVVDQDPTTLLCKALLALEASPESKWWKPDAFA
jgi:hypothetical protein